MASPSRLLPRAGWIFAALGAPWVVYACGLAPSQTGAATGSGGSGTTSSSHAASSSGATTTTTSTSTSATGTDGGARARRGGDGGDAGDAAEDAPACDTAVLESPAPPRHPRPDLLLHQLARKPAHLRGSTAPIWA